MFDITRSELEDKYLIREIFGDGTDIGFISTFLWDESDEDDRKKLCISCASSLGYIEYKKIGMKLYKEILVHDESNE
jgi:hypothetical protein